MKKTNILAVVILMAMSFNAKAQLRGLSYTLSPTAEYAKFNENTGLKDGLIVGGQFGFGFGQNVELSANYQQGLNFKTDNSNFKNIAENAIPVRDVDFTRYGGELKLNLSQTAVKPFIALGTGIQNIQLDGGDKFSQIYTNAGAGLKLTAFRRYTLGLQGNASFYNMNPHKALLTSTDVTNSGINLNDTKNELNSFYSLRASLIFHIGGRDPKKMSDLDAAYWENFSNGFRGISLPIEPTIMKIDFSENLNYRNEVFAGIQTGLDFGPMVGLRGFYFRGIEPGFDDIDEISIYGGEAKFKLNEGKGIVPFITMGGGYIDPHSGYPPARKQEGTGFASAGGGINIPFSKHFKVSGFVKTLLTSNSEVIEEIAQPSEINSSLAYGASLNFVIGGHKSSSKKIQQAKIDNALGAQKATYVQEMEDMKQSYSTKIDSLNQQIKDAVDNNDNDKVEELLEEKEATQSELEATEQEIQEEKIIETEETTEPVIEQETEVEIKQAQPAPSVQKNNDTQEQNGSFIKMTPAEFQLLLRDIIDSRRVQPQPIFVPVPSFYPNQAPMQPAPQHVQPQGGNTMSYKNDFRNGQYIEDIKVQYNDDLKQEYKNDFQQLKLDRGRMESELKRDYQRLQSDNAKIERDYQDLLSRNQKIERKVKKEFNEIEANSNKLEKKHKKELRKLDDKIKVLEKEFEMLKANNLSLQKELEATKTVAPKSTNTVIDSLKRP